MRTTIHPFPGPRLVSFRLAWRLSRLPVFTPVHPCGASLPPLLTGWKLCWKLRFLPRKILLRRYSKMVSPPDERTAKVLQTSTLFEFIVTLWPVCLFQPCKGFFLMGSKEGRYWILLTIQATVSGKCVRNARFLGYRSQVANDFAQFPCLLEYLWRTKVRDYLDRRHPANCPLNSVG